MDSNAGNAVAAADLHSIRIDTHSTNLSSRIINHLGAGGRLSHEVSPFVSALGVH